MHETTTKATVYADGDFRITVYETKTEFEAWISHLNYGISNLMFGMPKKQQNLDEFLEIVEWNLEQEEEFYLQEVY